MTYLARVKEHGDNIVPRLLKTIAILGTSRFIVPCLILLDSIPTVSAQGSGDEFSNNLFTDLAPLLALFGEQVVKQYLSQSTHWLEHVIFACGPLGIITAVTSAIRVAGAKDLMAIIGRAREPRAEAEIELMSSTSSEVCELWNGSGIVRVNGSPDVIELIYDPDYTNTGNPTSEQDNLGIYTLNEMKKVSGASTGSFLRAFQALFKMRELTPGDIPLYTPGSVNRAAPNISLNVAGHHLTRLELTCVAWIGLALQIGVLIFEGFITYYLRWKKGGQDVSGYAFPLTAVGTLAISAGMFICAYTIEASTEETEYEISSNGKGLQILWLQRAQNVSDQEFDSYAIYAAKNQERIITSRLALGNRRDLARLVSVGVINTITGFVLQFIGLRAMHYSASIGNLIVAATMTVLRTVIRRGLTREPDDSLAPSERSYSVHKICEGHELDLIAKNIMSCSFWNVITHGKPGPWSTGGLNKGTKVWQAKMRLAEISGARWEGELKSTVEVLTETIEALANYIWNPLGLGGITLSKHAKDLTTLDWYVLVHVGFEGEQRTEKIRMSLVREDADGRGPWLAKRKEVAATLCLWMSGFGQKPTEYLEKRNCLWLLDPNGESGDMGRILSDWWISRDNNRVEVLSDHLETTYTANNIDKRRVLDCAFPATTISPDIHAEFPDINIKTRPAFITQTSLLQMCAQYLISAFVSFAVLDIDPITSDTEIKMVKDQRLLTITNDGVRGLAERIKRHGLTTTEDAYRIIVPALSQGRKLPRVGNRILELLRTGRHWLPEGVKGGETETRAEEFYRLVQSLCTDEINTLIYQKKWSVVGCICGTLQKTFSDILGPADLRTGAVRKVVDRLCKDLVSSDTEPKCAPKNSKNPSRFPLHDAVRGRRASDVYHATQIGSIDVNSLDDNKQIPLHLAAALGKASLVKLLLFFGACPNTADGEQGRTSLHFAISGVKDTNNTERTEVVELLLQNGAGVDITDKGGNTALILAAENGHKVLAALLIDNAADMSARNEGGDSAVLLAAKGGHEAVVELMVKNRADVNTPNKSGDTALSMAAQIVHENIIRMLMGVGASMNSRLAAERGYELVLSLLIGSEVGSGVSREELDTAILLAAGKGRQRVTRLLLAKGADVDARNEDNNTPLILAAEGGYEDVVMLLLDNKAAVNATGDGDRTALLATGDNDRIVELLLQRGADIDARDMSQNTALHLAAMHGHERVVKLLLDHGADVNVKSDDFSTPLHWAASSGNEVVTRLVFEKHPDVNAQDENGDTALLIAIQGSHKAVVKFLIENGVDVNIPNNENWTAIRWASHLRDEDIERLLLDHGATTDS